MTVRSELLALKNKDGLIVPEVVLDWAHKHKKSKLYSAINWDVAWNAHSYMLLQVRNLITLYIRNEHRDPEMISLSVDRAEDGGGYREITDVLAVPRLRKIMLHDALHEIELLRRRFEELAELEPVWQAADTIRQRTSPKAGRGKGGEIRPTA